MNRYNFSMSNVTAAKKFLKGDAKREPSFLKRFKGTIVKGRLHLDGKLVVPKEKLETYLRNRIYAAKTPLSRDAAFYWISKDAVGVSRKSVDLFLKKQRIIRETDNQQASTKHKKRQVKTKGQLHIDLVEIKFNQLPFKPNTGKDIGHSKMTEEEKAEGESDVNKGYFFGCVDALTSMAYYRFAKYKNYKYITPIAKAGFQFMSKHLGVPIKKCQVYSDAGSEFHFKKYREWGMKTIIVKSSPIIENKNAQFQRAFYRIAKMKKSRHIHELTNMAMAQINRTVSSITKKAPVENLKEGVKDLGAKYNKKRGKNSGVKGGKRRALIPGKDKVRIQQIFDKDKGQYKAYLGKMWSKKLYPVTSKKGNRYVVNKKLYHRDHLRLTAEYDKESEKLLAKR